MYVGVQENIISHTQTHTHCAIQQQHLHKSTRFFLPDTRQYTGELHKVPQSPQSFKGRIWFQPFSLYFLAFCLYMYSKLGPVGGSSALHNIPIF